MTQTDEMLFATEAQQIQQRADQSVDIATEKYLIFSSDNLMYGIKAEQVKDIITDYAITGIPQVPNYVRGVINLRGQIIPILDVRLRLGKPSREDSLVVVLNLDGTQLGILVDAVDQMIDIPKYNILPMPAHNTQLLVSGMCSLPDGSGTMMVLDCEQLMPHD